METGFVRVERVLGKQLITQTVNEENVFFLAGLYHPLCLQGVQVVRHEVSSLTNGYNGHTHGDGSFYDRVNQLLHVGGAKEVDFAALMRLLTAWVTVQTAFHRALVREYKAEPL